jgi:hypothetical protein
VPDVEFASLLHDPVSLVDLVCLVCLVYFVQWGHDKRNRG